jgi:hypothetical protein
MLGFIIHDLASIPRPSHMPGGVTQTGEKVMCSLDFCAVAGPGARQGMGRRGGAEKGKDSGAALFRYGPKRIFVTLPDNGITK